MTTEYLNFGDFIQKKRIGLEITLRGMAERLGLSAPYLIDIEKGRRNPPEKKLEEIAAILNLTADEKALMYDLVGKSTNAVAPDLSDYIIENGYIAAALRTARDLDASEAEWLKFVDELRKRKR